jgi:hypothetical protein
MRAEIAAIKAETVHIPTIAVEVAPFGVQVADIRESVGIIEHDLFGVERIERRTGLSPQ